MANQHEQDSKAMAKAAQGSKKGGQQVTRARTATRAEVRQQMTRKQGHPK